MVGDAHEENLRGGDFQHAHQLAGAARALLDEGVERRLDGAVTAERHADDGTRERLVAGRQAGEGSVRFQRGVERLMIGRGRRRGRRQQRARRSPAAVVGLRAAAGRLNPTDRAVGRWCRRGEWRSFRARWRCHPFPVHRHQRGDAVLGRRMGGEEVVHAGAGERIDDEQMRRRRDCVRRSTFGIARRRVRDCASAEASAAGRPLISAPARSAEYSRVRLIAICTSIAASGATIAATSTPTMPSGIVVVAAAAEEEGEIGEHRDGAGDGRGDGHGQRVAVLHMAELVRHDAGDLLARQRLEEAGGGADGGMLRVAAGGEGVRLRVVGDVDARHGQAGAGGEVADDAVELRRAPLVDLAGAGHGEDQLVGVPVGEEVQPGGDQERDHAFPPSRRSGSRRP